jgi:hypothetical protein
MFEARIYPWPIDGNLVDLSGTFRVSRQRSDFLQKLSAIEEE